MKHFWTEAILSYLVGNTSSYCMVLVIVGIHNFAHNLVAFIKARTRDAHFAKGN